jgi:alpha-tubulin suppressor-like RCC1 family protein
LNTLPVLVNSVPLLSSASISTYYSLVLTTAGEVYACGFNNSAEGLNSGQLGQNNFNALSTFTKITFQTSLKMTKVYAGPNTAYSFDENGNLWSWGNIDKKGEDPFFKVLTQITTQVFDKVYAGNDVSMATRLTNGEPWGWGKNNPKIISNTNVYDVFYPIQIAGLIGVNISDISIGGDTNTAFVLAMNGQLGRLTTLVYSWGSNNVLQTGVDDTSISIVTLPNLAETPALFNQNITIYKLSTGAAHSAVTNLNVAKTSKSLNVWGDNSQGKFID